MLLGLPWLLLGVLSGVVVLPQTAVSLDFAEHLRLLEEKSIESWPADARTFRFLYVPPFPAWRVFSVRVQDLGNGPELVAKGATPDRGIEPRIHRTLTTKQWDSLRQARQAAFWTFTPDEYPRPGIADGSLWVLEGVAGGERLRIVQHVPKPGPFLDLCCEMFGLSGIELVEMERHTQIACRRPTRR